jgi:hypothetical protein
MVCFYVENKKNMFEPKVLEKVQKGGVEWIHKATLTDLCFIYQPSQIAAAVFSLAAKAFPTVDPNT